MDAASIMFSTTCPLCKAGNAVRPVEGQREARCRKCGQTVALMGFRIKGDGPEHQVVDPLDHYGVSPVRLPGDHHGA